MLNDEEEKFLLHWEKNRQKKTTIKSQLLLGLPLGLLMSIGILLNYVSGWYTRATMAANGSSTPLVLVFAFILITIFCTYFFRQHQREMNEQRYIELLSKKKHQHSTSAMQQEHEINSQVSN